MTTARIFGKTPSITLLAITLLAALLLSGCNSSSSPSYTGNSGGQPTSGGSTAPRGATSPVAMPTIEGPVANAIRANPWGAPEETLSPMEPDYQYEEYFVSGVAEGRDRAAEPDGTTADYTSRILVVRPKEQANFNGTVLVEWVNVTAEMEIDVVFVQTYKELLRQGYAYMAVSVQKMGVDNSPLGLKFWDPVRYLPMNHPNDSYAYDILAQATRALFATGDVRPMGELQVERVIAAGESQSAALLIPYVNKVDPVHRVFDGYFIHTFPGVINEDVAVPVLMLLTDTEVEGITSPVGYAAMAPDEFGQYFGNTPASILAIPMPVSAGPDHRNFRVWEIAGGSHYDKQALIYASAQLSRDLFGYTSYDGVPLGCTEASNLGVISPSIVPVPELGADLINQLAVQRPARAAVRVLNDWIISGVAPAIQPRINRNEDGTILRDEDGLATGGIRMPPMEVPIGVNEGTSCIFFGRYAQFDDAASRYTSLDDYLTQFAAAAQRAVDQGVLLQEEAQAYIDEAEQEAVDSGLWP